MIRSPRGRQGFTILEVLLALSVSGLLAVAAHRLVGQADDFRRVLGSRTREYNVIRGDLELLRERIGSLELRRPPTPGVRGGPEELRAPSWCHAPGGWLERCEITLHMETAGPGLGLRYRAPDGPRVVLDQEIVLGLRYLSDGSSGGDWVSAWTPEDGLPLAVGIVLDRDTIVLPVTAGPHR